MNATQLQENSLWVQEVFHILKRMHRAALIPEDDAEALQIGAVQMEHVG